MNVVLRVCACTIAAFLCHVAFVSTPVGVVRFELPFFLAYVCAVREPRPWIAGLMVFLPSVLLDVLDHQFAGALSHLIVFALIRRLKFVMDFARFPACLALGLVMAAADRLIYGALAGFQMGAGFSLVGPSLLDPAFALTAPVLPLGLWRGRA